MTNGLLIYGEMFLAFPHTLGSSSSYMTLQLLHSEFPYIWGKFDFLFCISVPVALCADALLVRCAPPCAHLAPSPPVARWVGGGAAGGPRVLHRATRHRLPPLVHTPAVARCWIYKDILRIKKDFVQFCQKRDLFIRGAFIYVCHCHYTCNFAKGA